MPETLADRIDSLLPQTQCTRCGYPDCRAYAEAVADGRADFNRCPPGGDTTLQGLATLLTRDPKPLDPAVGSFMPGTVAFIEEDLCIGCTKCIQACPTDAIVGAAKRMHTVIEALCTGCELCLPPCPVDCIRLQPARGATTGLNGWTFPAAGEERTDALRRRYHRHVARVERRRELAAPLPASDPDAIARRKAEIAAAVARVQAKRAARKQGDG